MSAGGASGAGRTVERVQTGVRLEKRMLKVLKGLAELLDLSLGDLLEGIVLHAFEGKTPFSPATRAKVEELKALYGFDLAAEDSHRLREERPAAPRRRAGRPRRGVGSAGSRRE
jgi:hypothetical protein